MTTAGATTLDRRDVVATSTSPSRADPAPPLGVTHLTSRDWANWDRFVRRHPQGTVFHTMAWMHSVRDAFRHTPHYLLAKRADRIVGVLPLFCVNSWLGGRMMVSVPYAVGGGPVAENDATRDALIQHAIDLSIDQRANVLDLRCESSGDAGLQPVNGYVGFKRQLPDEPEQVLEWLPRKARAAARNAETKYQLTASFDAAHLATVWRLYCLSMRRLGSVAYPYRFFEELVARMGRRAFVQVIRKNRRIIAGLVSFRFGDTFLPYFAGCDDRYRYCSPNNYLYLTAMRKAVTIGCTVFDFGRTRETNRGSYDFKRFHGFAPTPLSYQRWSPPGAKPVNLTPDNPRLQRIRQVWKWMPLPVTQLVGGFAARHIPG